MFFRKRYILLVEGPDDAAVFSALCRELGIKHLEINAVWGSSKFKPAIYVTAKIKRLTSLGIVRDADDNGQSAFQSLQSSLKRNNLPVPRQPAIPTTGTTPRVTIMIMPPAPLGTNRALEDVLYASIDTPEISAIVDGYIAEMEAQGITFRELDHTKVRIHAFLATYDPPGMTIVEAVRFGLFDWSHPAFDPLKAFLEHVAHRA